VKPTMTQSVRFAIAARTLRTFVVGQTRMSGGAGRAVSNGGPYLIYVAIGPRIVNGPIECQITNDTKRGNRQLIEGVKNLFNPK